MLKVIGEQRFYGSIDDFCDFIEKGGFEQVHERFDPISKSPVDRGTTYIDKNANMVRIYKCNSYKCEVYWRYVPYNPETCISESGYKLVSIRGKQYTMQQIMAWTFIENDDPEKKEVDHIDGDKTNNKLSNLRWVTRRENMKSYYNLQAERKARGETGVNAFIERLKQQEDIRYTPTTNIRLFLNFNNKKPKRR